MMEPLFFGPPHQQLYGVYHAAVRSRASSTGVVLCYPAGQEYIRIHRAFRWMADQLAAAGFHVLRFDYTGQGDSAGSFADATLDRWIADGQLAIEELQAITGVRQVDVVGLRIGTLVAAALADLPSVRRLVLWESRPESGAFRTEMLQHIPNGHQRLNDFVDDNGAIVLNGFTFSSEFLSTLDAFDLQVKPGRPITAALLIGAEEPRGLSGFAARLRALGTRVDSHVVGSPTVWNSVDLMGGLFLPIDTLRHITGWLDDAA